MKLDRQEAFDVAHKLIMYFNDFKRIDDYFRSRKIERVKKHTSSFAWVWS